MYTILQTTWNFQCRMINIIHVKFHIHHVYMWSEKRNSLDHANRMGTHGMSCCGRSFVGAPAVGLVGPGHIGPKRPWPMRARRRPEVEGAAVRGRMDSCVGAPRRAAAATGWFANSGGAVERMEVVWRCPTNKA